MSNIIKSFFKDHTIVHALDNHQIQQDLEKNKNLNLTSKIKKGIYIGAKGYVQTAMLGGALLFAARQFFDYTNITQKSSFFGSVLLAPIIEEILHRSLLQNAIHSVQKFAKWAAPTSLKNTRPFEWLASPSSRILTTYALFSLPHLINAGNYLSTAEAVAQVCAIFLVPNLSILYETTGNIAAPLAAHMVHNALSQLIEG